MSVRCDPGEEFRLSNDKGAIPTIAIIVSIVMTLVGLGFAIGYFFHPSGLLKGLDLTNPAAQRAAFSLGSRSLTMALALLLALILRSRLALICMLSMRAGTELLDLFNMIGSPAATPAVFTIPMIIICELLAIALLWRSLTVKPSSGA
jgi:hypothetical protein